MHDNSLIEINREAFESNWQFLKQHFGKKVLISSVVKGNAYGHGIKPFVTMALESGVTHFSVFDCNEARQVNEVVKNRAEIMIMGWIENTSIPWAIENNVSIYVFEKKRLEASIKSAKKLGKKVMLHIEIETGMNRTGFQPKEISSLIKYLKKEQDHFIFQGLCTHYAGAESIANYYRVKNQMDQYPKLYTRFCAEGLTPILRHTACSAAAMMYPETCMDMVRIGIMQYGLWPSPEAFVNYLNVSKKHIDPLRRVISWKSKVMSIRKVTQGQFIGYGNSYMASENMKIAVVPIGYAHGYSRTLSNQGRVLISGYRCQVIGTINMNMMLVDVSEILNIHIGDEVVLIGRQDNLDLSVASFSDFSNLLNYELLTRLSQEIPRIII
ncbi:MAG: alanine racemase [Saprospiraceae bacterium]|nr:alanine racemase [Candidatus Brachybacter algidus]